MVTDLIINKAKTELRKLHEYISKDSLQNAGKVRVKIIESIMHLSTKWEQYPPDKYKKTRDINFRAYEIARYRISYHYIDNKIPVTRIRHSKMNPIQY